MKYRMLRLCLFFLFVGQLEAATITLTCGAVGGFEHSLCKEAAEEWAKKNNHSIKVITPPNSTTERLALFQQLLASKSSDIDVFYVDTIWPGILQKQFEDLKPYLPLGRLERIYPAALDSHTVEGRLIAMPWFIDAGLLYYRKDLLTKYNAKVPETWEELLKTGQAIQSSERKTNPDIWGFVFQGRAYEGLTCNALEWVASHRGGRIVDSKGEVTINNPYAHKAVELIASHIGKSIPKGVLNYTEEETRGVFQSGNAVFLRSWPYVWKLAGGEDSQVAGKIAVASLPRGEGGQSVSVLGGWSYALSRYSKHKKLAADLIMYMTSLEKQKHNAIVGGFNPVYPELFKDKKVLEGNPVLRDLRIIFSQALARPSQRLGSKYTRVSHSFWEAVHRVLSKKYSAKKSFNKLERKLKRMRGSAW